MLRYQREFTPEYFSILMIESKMKAIYLSCVVFLALFYGHLEAAFFEVGYNHSSIVARTAYDIGESPVYWPNGYVPYRFAYDFDDGYKDTIRAVFREFKEYCVNFQELPLVGDYETTDYVTIKHDPNKPKCHADAGFLRGEQFMTDNGKDCFRFHVLRHQALHILGFKHEHQRPDRDCFILFKNQIDTTSEILQKNDKLSTAFPYDIHSLMHFGLLYVDQYRQVSGNPTEHWRGWPFPAASKLSDLDKYKVSYIYCHKNGRQVGDVYNEDYSPEKWCKDHQKMCEDDRVIKQECNYTDPQPAESK